MAQLKVAVMASGGGTNLQQLLDRFPSREDPSAAAEVVLVVSDRPGVGALERAHKAGIRTEVIDPGHYESSSAFGRRLIELCRAHSIGLIVLAGYLKMIPAELIVKYRNRIINIHPALLPGFGGKGMYGRKVHEAVLAAGVKISGCTVHFVDELFDHGPIIAQRTVPVFHTDTPESLAERVLVEEHRLLPEVVELIAAGRVEVADGIARVNSPDKT
ncbi:MAG: phosphoribosylglycinamide formyltransferase [Candidatus Glassbacteria bacterium]|nr:phosphoribosylglycinamide formyltransferase [Candidatus Glassbacteria bacterium]